MRIVRNGLMLATVIATLTLGYALAQGIGEPSTTPITTEECKAAWDKSSASSSCTTIVLSANMIPGTTNYHCAVKTNCAATPDGAHDVFSDWHGGPPTVETLVNCNGHLSQTCE